MRGLGWMRGWCQLAVEHDRRTSGDCYSITDQLDPDQSRARGCLEADERVASKPVGPERTQHCVRAAGYWIFSDPCLRCEETRYEVVDAPGLRRGGDDHSGCVESCYRLQIGTQLTNASLVMHKREQKELVLGAAGPFDLRAKRLTRFPRAVDLTRRPRGEIHRQ